MSLTSPSHVHPLSSSLRIRTNYVNVKSFPDHDVTHYDVSFTPDIPPVFIRRLFKAWEDKYIDSPQIKGVHPVFDGRKNMFSARPLPFGETHTFEVEVGFDVMFLLVIVMCIYRC